MAVENQTEVIDTVEEAKEKVEDAQENLERVEIEQKIDSVEATAQTAIDIALDVSNESQTAIENVRDELIQQEENNEWQRQRIHELMTQMDCLREELSILKLSPPIPQQPEIVMETEVPPETVAPETIITPETKTETSNETKTEPLSESADGEPVLQTVLNPRRKIRLI